MGRHGTGHWGHHRRGHPRRTRAERNRDDRGRRHREPGRWGHSRERTARAPWGLGVSRPHRTGPSHRYAGGLRRVMSTRTRSGRSAARHDGTTWPTARHDGTTWPTARHDGTTWPTARHNGSVRSAARRGRTAWSAAPLGAALRAPSDRPTGAATGADRSRRPGHRWDWPGRTSTTHGIARAWTATRSHRASHSATRPGHSVQCGSARARSRWAATRHTGARRTATRCTCAGRPTARHTRTGRAATR
jgi:hypothetical protein